MRDGVVSVDAEGDQDVGGAVSNRGLEEPDELTGRVAGVPLDRYPPYQVRQHAYQAHHQVWNKTTEPTPTCQTVTI